MKVEEGKPFTINTVAEAKEIYERMVAYLTNANLPIKCTLDFDSKRTIAQNAYYHRMVTNYIEPFYTSQLSSWYIDLARSNKDHMPTHDNIRYMLLRLDNRKQTSKISKESKSKHIDFIRNYMWDNYNIDIPEPNEAPINDYT